MNRMGYVSDSPSIRLGSQHGVRAKTDPVTRQRRPPEKYWNAFTLRLHRLYPGCLGSSSHPPGLVEFPGVFREFPSPGSAVSFVPLDPAHFLLLCTSAISGADFGSFVRKCQVRRRNVGSLSEFYPGFQCEKRSEKHPDRIMRRGSL
ncbi:unnamed protein product [Notodromas monacha]|uniref:Uncharacterized protein n=1 Tax=Notodromas monacha TaxID=399045 RepID=A0A7R9G7P4_9CRUS|nr:unnamed protein product [Notodromas monacha]CAG0912276.1 unnamed protein product [Notodromas monacha]